MRLLNKGDRILPTDELLMMADCDTWILVGSRFKGQVFDGNTYMPMRRKLNAQAQHDTYQEGIVHDKESS